MFSFLKIKLVDLQGFSDKINRYQKSFIPVLVESSSTVLTKVLSKDGLKSSQSLGGFNVANHTDNHHWWSLKDSNRLHNLLLVGLYKGIHKIKLTRIMYRKNSFLLS